MTADRGVAAAWSSAPLAFARVLTLLVASRARWCSRPGRGPARRHGDRAAGPQQPAGDRVRVALRPKFDWAAVRALPEVAELTKFSALDLLPIDGVSDPYVGGARRRRRGHAPRSSGRGRRRAAWQTRLVRTRRSSRPASSRATGGVGDVVTGPALLGRPGQLLQAGSPAPPKPKGPAGPDQDHRRGRSPWYSDDSGVPRQVLLHARPRPTYPENIIGDGTANALGPPAARGRRPGPVPGGPREGFQAPGHHGAGS